MPPGDRRVVVGDLPVVPTDPRVPVGGPRVVVGLGARPGASAADLRDAVDAVLAAAGLAGSAVSALATVDRRAGDPGVRGLAADRGWHLAGLPAAELARQPVPHPSGTVAAAVGTPSVAEAAALRVAGPGAELIVAKQIFPRVTVAVAVIAGSTPG